MSVFGKSGYSLYRGIILPLRQVDETAGGLLLQRYLDASVGANSSLVGPQQSFERTEQDIQTLLDQFDPYKVRSDLLRHLLAIVGFTADLRRITDRLSEEQLRRLVKLAVPLWNQRHTELGIVNAVRLMTGRTAHLTNWFGYRWILEENILGENTWIIGGSSTPYDEYWTNIRIMDDGSIDEILLIEILRLERAMSERIEILLVDFLDKYDRDLNSWDIDGVSPTVADGVLTIPAETTITPIIPILTSASQHTGYVVSTKFRLSSGASFRARWHVDAIEEDWYELEISMTSPKISLKRMIGGSEATILSHEAPDLDLIEDLFYALRIQVQTVGADRLIRCYVDDSPVVPDGTGGDYIDTPPGAALPYGIWAFQAVGGEVDIDNTESWRFVPEPRLATIQLGTPEARGGEAWRSSTWDA